MAPSNTALQRLELFRSLAHALSTARTIGEVAAVTAREACSAVSARGAFVLAPRDESATLELLASHGSPAADLRALEKVGIDEDAARVFRTGTGTWEAASASLPLVVADRPVGLVGLSFDEATRLGPDDRGFLETMLDLCALSLDRVRHLESEAVVRARLERAERAAWSAAERLGAVLEAGEAIARASEPDDVLGRLTRATVPGFADWCSVDLVDATGGLTLAAVAHVDPARVAYAREHRRRYPLDPATSSPHRVVLTGKAELFPHVTDEMLAAAIADPEELRMTRAIGLASVMIVPLIAHDRVLGALTIISSRADLIYDATDVRLAEKLASRAALALYNARLIQELRDHANAERSAREGSQRAATRLRILAEASRAFAEARLSEEEVGAALAGIVATKLGDGCVVQIVERDGVRIQPLAIVQVDPRRQADIAGALATMHQRVGEFVHGKVIATGEPMLIDPTREEERARHPPELAPMFAKYGIRSMVVVPMRSHGSVIGSMGVTRDTDPPYDADDVALFVELADRATIAITNARLHAAETEARRHVERLQLVTSALGEAATPEEVADVILDHAQKELGGDALFLHEYSPGGREIVLARHREVPPEAVALLGRLPLTPSGMAVLKGGVPVFVETHEAYAEAFPHAAETIGPLLGVKALVSLPLAVKGGAVLGVLTIVLRKERSFTGVDRAFAKNLAEQCAQALERARLYAAERTAKSEAESANRLKDEFLATVSHELRTPLNAILGWASLLRSGRLEPESHARALATIERNARAQARLVDDVLDVSRITTGKLAIRSEPVDIGAVLQLALDVIRPAALAKELTVHVDVDAGLRARGDADRLQQVYWNLLSNAVKFTPRGGTIRVVARQEGEAAAVIVQDSGQGVHPDFLPHIFEAFRQADGTSTRAHGGLGLGLSIARQLVQLQGGEITAASEGVGRGCTFTVTLPATTDAAAVAATGRHRAASRLLGIDVLVVDDDADARELAAMVLSGEGAQVRTAASGRQAVDAIAEKTPAVLVCDIGMPEEDGLALLPRARAAAHGTFPAVAYTAYADAESADAARRAGFDAHVTKPVDVEQLVVAVASVLG